MISLNVRDGLMSKRDDNHSMAEDYLAQLTWVSNTFHHYCLQFRNE